MEFRHCHWPEISYVRLYRKECVGHVVFSSEFLVVQAAVNRRIGAQKQMFLAFWRIDHE